MNLINLTPHDITVYHEDGTTTTIKSSGIARVETSDAQLTPITLENGKSVPICSSVFGDTIGLPDFEYGTALIVSMVVVQANRTRFDLICPDTFKGAVRDSEGKIIGTKGFAAYW